MYCGCLLNYLDYYLCCCCCYCNSVAKYRALDLAVIMEPCAGLSLDRDLQAGEKEETRYYELIRASGQGVGFSE